MLIQISPNQIQLSASLLGSDEAWVWVGSAYSPLDNDDTRVKETRDLMEKYYPHVPCGMWVGNKEENGMKPLVSRDGFYALDVSWWPAGVYRINLHSSAGIESPYGSKLRPEKRDQECSWAPLEKFQSELAKFLHKEENGAGYSLRFLIRPNRTLEAFGDTQ